ncbi:MAG: sigma factor-like helix-turn-helix DNA-binding protein [Patescibacteria group bacterium]
MKDISLDNDKRDKQIFIDLYGLEDGIVKTLEEVGGKNNLSVERIRQIEEKISNQLKNSPRFMEIAEEMLEDYNK